MYHGEFVNPSNHNQLAFYANSHTKLPHIQAILVLGANMHQSSTRNRLDLPSPRPARKWIDGKPILIVYLPELQNAQKAWPHPHSLADQGRSLLPSPRCH